VLQPGYKSRFQYFNADYFNLFDKDRRVATTQRELEAPATPKQFQVLSSQKNLGSPVLLRTEN